MHCLQGHSYSATQNMMNIHVFIMFVHEVITWHND
jgi:hypothetical protein